MSQLDERQVPEVRQFSHQADGVFHFGGLQAIGAQKFIHGNADGNGATVADGFLGILDHFAQQAGPVFEGAAIFVAPHIGGARQELLKNAKAVSGIDIDKIITGRAGAQGCSAVGAAKIFDILLVHGAGLDRAVERTRHRHGGGRHGNFARPEV